MPIFNPMPPLDFFDDRDIPINVRINAAAVEAYLFSLSISNALILATPRIFCLSTYSVSCGVVSVSQSFAEMRKSRGSIGMMVSLTLPDRMVSFMPSKSRII